MADGAARAGDAPCRVRLSDHGTVQVVQNLVQNAADAMGDTGTITVRLARSERVQAEDSPWPP